MYNNFRGPRRVYKLNDIYRKEWLNIDIFSLSRWVDRMDKVFPGYVLNYGLTEKCMFIDMKNIIGIPANQIIHDQEFIKKIINFCIDNIKQTKPFAHMDWSMSNIIVNDDRMQMVDWDALKRYPYSLIEYKLNNDLELAFGNKLQNYISLEEYGVQKF